MITKCLKSNSLLIEALSLELYNFRSQRIFSKINFLEVVNHVPRVFDFYDISHNSK